MQGIHSDKRKQILNRLFCNLAIRHYYNLSNGLGAHPSIGFKNQNLQILVANTE